jgi:hypothetical protein
MLALGGVGLALGGTGVALARTGTTNGTPQDRPARPAKILLEDRDAFLNDVAKRAGVDPAKLRSALQDLRAGGKPALRFGALFGGLRAAAGYLGLQPRELITQLQSKTLAQIAADRKKSVDGLKQALHDATKTALDRAVTNKRITQAQADQALARLDASLDDLINGRNPEITALATKLGIDRDKLANAIRDAKLAEVDKALADKRITQAQADRLKARIQAGEQGPFGFGFFRGPGGPGGRGGPGPGPGHARGDCPAMGKGQGGAAPRQRNGDFAPPPGAPPGAGVAPGAAPAGVLS